MELITATLWVVILDFLLQRISLYPPKDLWLWVGSSVLYDGEFRIVSCPFILEDFGEDDREL